VKKGQVKYPLVCGRIEGRGNSGQFAVGSWQWAVCSWQFAVGSLQLAVCSGQFAVGSWQ